MITGYMWSQVTIINYTNVFIMDGDIDLDFPQLGEHLGEKTTL